MINIILYLILYVPRAVYVRTVPRFMLSVALGFRFPANFEFAICIP
jgi:hypothetical protein